MKTWRMRTSCWTTKTAHTLTICNTHYFSNTAMFAGKCLIVKLYVSWLYYHIWALIDILLSHSWPRELLHPLLLLKKKVKWSRYRPGVVKVKVKIKWSRYRPGVAQRVGRGIALLFHDRGTRLGWVASNTPRPHFTPGKDPVPILIVIITLSQSLSSLPICNWYFNTIRKVCAGSQSTVTLQQPTLLPDGFTLLCWSLPTMLKPPYCSSPFSTEDTAFLMKRHGGQDGATATVAVGSCFLCEDTIHFKLY